MSIGRPSNDCIDPASDLFFRFAVDGCVVFIFLFTKFAYTHSLATTDSKAPDISQQAAQLLVTLDQADAVKSSLHNETQRLRDKLQKFLHLEQLRNKEARVTQQLKEERELTAKVIEKLSLGFVTRIVIAFDEGCGSFRHAKVSAYAKIFHVMRHILPSG